MCFTLYDGTWINVLCMTFHLSMLPTIPSNSDVGTNNNQKKATTWQNSMCLESFYLWHKSLGTVEGDASTGFAQNGFFDQLFTVWKHQSFFYYN